MPGVGNKIHAVHVHGRAQVHGGVGVWQRYHQVKHNCGFLTLELGDRSFCVGQSCNMGMPDSLASSRLPNTPLVGEPFEKKSTGGENQKQFDRHQAASPNIHGHLHLHLQLLVIITIITVATSF